MTQDRRKDDKLPEGPLVFTDRNLTAAGLAHLEAEKAAACLVHAKDDIWVGVGTKDALRGLLSEDAASQSQAVPSELASLKELALAATPGPWVVRLDGTCSGTWPHIETAEPDEFGDPVTVAELPTSHVETKAARESDEMPGAYPEAPHRFEKIEGAPSLADAAFIAAANPAVILKLIEQVESLSHSAATGKAEDLPELPEPAFKRGGSYGVMLINSYDANQMRGYARAALASPAAPLAGKAEPTAIYQVKAGQDWWHDTDKEHWDNYVPESRRIVYTAPLAAAVPAEEAKPAAEQIARVILRLIGEYAMDWHSSDPDDGFNSHDEELNVLVDLVNKALAKDAPAEPAPILASALTDGRILSIAEETAINYVTDERHPDNATIIDFAREIEKEIARLSTPTAQGTAALSRDPDVDHFTLAQVQTIAESIKPGDGWGAEDWEFALANAVARHIAAQAPAGRDAQNSARWQFMMRVADNDTGPEFQAMESVGDEKFDEERPKSVQLEEMADAAMAKCGFKPAASHAQEQLLIAAEQMAHASHVIAGTPERNRLLAAIERVKSHAAEQTSGGAK